MKRKRINNPVEDEEFRRLVKLFQYYSAALITGCLDDNSIAWKDAVLHRAGVVMDDLIKIQVYVTSANIKDPSKKSFIEKIVSFFKFKKEPNVF